MCTCCKHFNWEFDYSEFSFSTIRYGCSIKNTPKGEVSFFMGTKIPVGEGSSTKFNTKRLLNPISNRPDINNMTALFLTVPDLHVEDCDMYNEDKLISDNHKNNPKCSVGGYCKICEHRDAVVRYIKWCNARLVTLICKHGLCPNRYLYQTHLNGGELVEISDDLAKTLISKEDQYRVAISPENKDKPNTQSKSTVKDLCDTLYNNIKNVFMGGKW
jgi:hypothetical protein